MRICMVTTFYPPFHFGGDGTFVYQLSHALADRGHVVEVVHHADAYRGLKGTPPAKGYAEHPGVRRHALESPAGMLEVLAMQQTGRPFVHEQKLRALLEDGRFDVVHFHNVSLMGGPTVLSYGSARKLYTLHEHWLVCPMHILWRYDREPCEERTCVRCQLAGKRPPQLWRSTGLIEKHTASIDAFIAPSRFTQRKHRQLGLRGPIRHVPHFVREPVIDATVRPAGGEPYFLYVGRIEKPKGAHTLIDAFRRFRGASLVIAGEGTDRAMIEEMARDLPHVRFAGRLAQGELGAYYRGAIATIVPSLCYEVFGLTGAESMAAGTPVLVRNLGALPELVADSGAGFAYATEDELIGRLCELAAELALRANLRARARRTFEERWTLDVHLDRYEALIHELERGPLREQDDEPDAIAGDGLGLGATA